MSNIKLLNFVFSSFLTSSILNNAEKPFLNQEIKTLASVPNNEIITSTFVDAKNTVWVITNEDEIYYKLEKENSFKTLPTFNAVFSKLKNNRANSDKVFYNFVKVNYSKDPTFFIYANSLGDIKLDAPIFKVTYNQKNNDPELTTYFFDDIFEAITAMWADDRGVLVVATDINSKTQVLYEASSLDLLTLRRTIQPDASVFANDREVTAMFRADKSSPMQNTIVLATSNVNPNSEVMIFDPNNATILTATSLSGDVFNQIIDTKSSLTSYCVFNNAIVSKYTATNKPAYLLTGSATNNSTPIGQPAYAINIGLDDQNKLTFHRVWKYEQDNVQTKNMVAIGNYVYTAGKDALSGKYTVSSINSFYQEKEPVTDADFANKPADIADASNMNVNISEYSAKLAEVSKNSSDLYFYMPSFAGDNNGNLYIGISHSVLYLGSLPENNSSKAGLIIGVTLGVVAAVAIAGGTAWYFLKKKKSQK